MLAAAVPASSWESVVLWQPFPMNVFTPIAAFGWNSHGHCSHCMIGKKGFPSTTTWPLRTAATWAAAAGTIPRDATRTSIATSRFKGRRG